MVGLAEAEKLNKMSTLLERLHAKYNQNRPWTETMKLVRQVMVRRAGIRAGGCWSSFFSAKYFAFWSSLGFLLAQRGWGVLSSHPQHAGRDGIPF